MHCSIESRIGGAASLGTREGTENLRSLQCRKRARNDLRIHAGMILRDRPVSHQCELPYPNHAWRRTGVDPVQQRSTATGAHNRNPARLRIASDLIPPRVAAAPRNGWLTLIGVGQEKASAWRSWAGKKRDHRGRPLQEWGRQMTFVNHFYFYLWDAEWGPAFWKVNCYAPFPVWIWLNGHEWAKRQLDKARIGYAALDNGFRSCDKPALLQRLCDRLGPGAVSGFFWRWFPRLPQVFTAVDLRAGDVYEPAFRQFEVADTRVFSRPAAGRAFFEGLIRDHLDIGRPDCVSLTFGRRVLATTPGAFRTKVVTEGVDPQVSCYYKASRIKQYFKGHRALRTETVICDTRDFGIGRRVCLENWNALRAVGEHANQRLCDAEAADAQPAPDTVTSRCRGSSRRISRRTGRSRR